MRAGDVPLYGAASAGQMGAAGLITRAGAATVQGELGSAKNPVYMMQVPLRLRTLHPKYLSLEKIKDQGAVRRISLRVLTYSLFHEFPCAVSFLGKAGSNALCQLGA